VSGSITPTAGKYKTVLTADRIANTSNWASSTELSPQLDRITISCDCKTVPADNCTHNWTELQTALTVQADSQQDRITTTLTVLPVYNYIHSWTESEPALTVIDTTIPQLDRITTSSNCARHIYPTAGQN
jgi:hypothetical protein